MRFLPLALWLAGVAMGQAAPDAVPIPEGLKGSYIEYVPWVWQTLGWPGLCLLLGWSARTTMKAAAEFKGMPVRIEGPLVIQVDANGPPVVIQVHPDTVSKFVPRPPVPKDS